MTDYKYAPTPFLSWIRLEYGMGYTISGKPLYIDSLWGVLCISPTPIQISHMQ
jgi:hypothetical protein